MPTPPASPTLPLLQRRTIRVLIVAELLGALGLAAGDTGGPLLLAGSLLLGGGNAAVMLAR